MFAPGRPFQPSLMFMGSAFKVLHFKGRLLTLPSETQDNDTGENNKNMTLSIMTPGVVSQHFNFFVAYKWAPNLDCLSPISLSSLV